MLNRLQRLNPAVALYDVNDKEFSSYGRILRDWDVTALLQAARRLPMPAEGSSYQPAVEEFECLPLAERIERECFGALPAQLGYCRGHSHFLNAAEWHTSCEINIAVTPLVLFLAHIWELDGSSINSARFKAFYLPAGTAVEVYATSLHFCPCEVEESGFGCAVGLPQGTNTPLPTASADPLLFRKNKWILAHTDNRELIERGVRAGITGVNHEIKY